MAESSAPPAPVADNTVAAPAADPVVPAESKEPQGTPIGSIEVQEPDLSGAIAGLTGGVKGAVKDNVDPFKGVLDNVDSDNNSTASGDNGPDDGAGDKSNNSTESKDVGDVHESTVTKDTSQPTTELKVEADPAGVYAATEVQDPGEFQPQDYSFGITTTDGKVHQIKSPEDADAFADLIDKDPELMSAKALLEFTRNANKMEAGIDTDKKTWETQKEEFDKTTAQNETVANTYKGIENGMAYLEKKGDLPAVDPQYATANWEDAEVAKQPGVKERLDILAFIAKENVAREAAGLDPSFDVLAAHTAMELEAMKTNAKQEEDEEKKTRQVKAAMIGGNAPFIPSNVPSNKIVGPGGNISDLR